MLLSVELLTTVIMNNMQVFTFLVLSTLLIISVHGTCHSMFKNRQQQLSMLCTSSVNIIEAKCERYSRVVVIIVTKPDFNHLINTPCIMSNVRRIRLHSDVRRITTAFCLVFDHAFPSANVQNNDGYDLCVSQLY